MRDGFTLVELLVAIAVFALLSVTAYAGLNNIIDQNHKSAARGERLVDFIHAVEGLRTDIEQTVNRGIRDQLGNGQAALVGGSRSRWLLEFTRNGHENRLGFIRSGMQRIAYSVEGGALVRLDWVMLDRPHSSAPRRRVLLQDVNEVVVRFLDRSRAWHSTWPPLAEREADDLPLAVEVRLQTPDWGDIVQLYRVPSG